MKTLLAVDGSEHSIEAVRLLQYFSTTGVIVLHAMNVPRPAYPMMVPEAAAELYKDLEQSMRADGERLLNRTVSLLPPHTGPVTKVIETGSPAEVIVKTAQEEKVDLIVMGARGLGPIKERVLGSVSHRIVTAAPCPKLIVSRPVKAIQKVLLPLASSSDTEDAVRFLERKPFRQAVELSLLSVLLPIHPNWGTAALATEALQARQVENAQLFLQSTANQLKRMGYTVRSHVMVGTAVESILEQAQGQRADLILMGSRGREGVLRLVLGSVSHAVLHSAPCPTLVFN